MRHSSHATIIYPLIRAGICEMPDSAVRESLARSRSRRSDPMDLAKRMLLAVFTSAIGRSTTSCSVPVPHNERPWINGACPGAFVRDRLLPKFLAALN
jgi:hypothetical protein